MMNKLTLILAASLSMVACSRAQQRFDFDTLKPEVLNPGVDTKSTNTEGVKLSGMTELSLLSNSTDVCDYLLMAVLYLCKEKGKDVVGNLSELDPNGELDQFVTMILNNQVPSKPVELEMDGQKVTFEYVNTFYSNFDLLLYRADEGYRYSTDIKYHLKMTLNPNGDMADGMKHLVYITDGTFLNAKALKN